MTHVTCRLTAKNRDQLRNPTLGNRVWATFTFLTHQTAPRSRAAAVHSQFKLVHAKLFPLGKHATVVASPVPGHYVDTCHRPRIEQ